MVSMEFGEEQPSADQRKAKPVNKKKAAPAEPDQRGRNLKKAQRDESIASSNQEDSDDDSDSSDNQSPVDVFSINDNIKQKRMSKVFYNTGNKQQARDRNGGAQTGTTTKVQPK